MLSKGDDLAAILSATELKNNDVQHYSVVDAAQDDRLPGALRTHSVGLFGAGADTPIGRVSPHLAELPRNGDAPGWRWIAHHAAKRPCLTVLASTLNFKDLLRHLQAFLEVKIGSTRMHLAWWDPAILATLVGQPDDDTLFEAGPIFDEHQRAALLAPILTWWYWDRRGALHNICAHNIEFPAVPSMSDGALPLVFKPDQTSRLVHATLPDRVLYELRLNQPDVLLSRNEWENYDVARRLLPEAKAMGIRGLRDQVNFVGAGMILGEEFYKHPAISSHLENVRCGQTSFTNALQTIPADALERATQAST